MASNVDILSRGAKVYAKKRKAKKDAPEEVVFDMDKRREYLTGFHKRKVERHNTAVQKAKERERLDRIEQRRAHREQIAQAAEAKVAAYKEFMAKTRIDSDDDENDSDDEAGSGEEEGDEERGQKERTSQFRTPETLTTVTVIEEMGEDDGFATIAPSTSQHHPQQSSTTATEKKEKEQPAGDDQEEEDGDDSRKAKKSKFRYETKASVKRRQDAKRAKLKAKGSAAGGIVKKRGKGFSSKGRGGRQ